MTNTTHWTERSTEDFLYSIASDFIEDLKEKMRILDMSQSKLAKEAKVHKSFVSRVFKDPGNLTLDTIVKFARTAGMKVSIVTYEDGDKKGEHGPIDASVFRVCWERQSKPRDNWSLQQSAVAIKPFYFVPKGRHGYGNVRHRRSKTTEGVVTSNLTSVIREFEATTAINEGAFSEGRT